MPAIDLARLRKQTGRLADFFFVPQEFLNHLREILESYVNYSLRTKERVAPRSNLTTYRTPPVVLRGIENELQPIAQANPAHALDLADLLWEQGTLETSLLAAFLLGCIPAQEVLLLARLTAWVQQVRDPRVRSELLTTSTAGMRSQAPSQFLELVKEWLHPERPQSWSNGIQALLPFLAEAGYDYLPAVLDLVEPAIDAGHVKLQLDLEELIIALYAASHRETLFFLKQLLAKTSNPMTAVSLRRMLPALPAALQSELRASLRAPASTSSTATEGG